jgi:acetylxylan esterase
MDAICGGSGSPFSNITAVPSDVVKGNVVAVVLLGNPSHNPNSTFEKGTSKNEGIFPREDDGACKDYGDRMASYCDTGDVYCDRGDNREIHGHYLAEYGDDIVDFIVDRYEQSSTPTSDDSPSGTPGPETTSEPATPDSAAPNVAPAAGVMVLAGLAMMAML